MLRTRSAFEAYRDDLASAPEVATFGGADGQWLLLAELLRCRTSALRAGDEDRRRAVDEEVATTLAAMRGAIAGGDGVELGPSALVAQVLHVAADVEERGALHLAHAMLRLLLDAVPEASLRERGRVVAQQARIARKTGALDAAHDLYDQVARLGRRSADADLVARAQLGQAVIARRRGNYPESRRRYERALHTARRHDLRELAGLAHHGLLIAAGAAGDVETALRHGWEAFELMTGDPALQADVLANLGAVSSMAGHHRAALRAYLGVARRSSHARVRLPALAGAAASAARVGDVGELLAATIESERELRRSALPYEHAQALALLATAWRIHAPRDDGEPYRSRALAIASAHGFHELTLECERATEDAAAGLPAARWRPARRTGTHRVLRALELLDLEETPDAVGSR